MSFGRIPDSFIESIIAKTDIVSVIQESVQLKKAGNNYQACCPFHAEKTPSFTVSPTKQFYHCFGCGAHGDAIRFVMENESMPFVDAVERIASRLGLKVPRDEKETAKIQERLNVTSVLNEVADFYAQQLKNHPSAQQAVTYLKGRGLTGEVAKAFSVGYAPPGWDHLVKQYQNNSAAFSLLEQTGLVIRHKEGRFYDRFRERVMFPIRDRKGEVIGFGGRVLDKGEPKYLNSPESAVFQKSYCLYGLYEALKFRDKWKTAIVVEGYLDVIALAQFGIQGAFATLGTALTSHHLTQLFHLANDVVFCFDGDKAGQNAAFKALQLVLPLISAGRQVRFCFLGQGDDPDSFVRQQGAEAFRAQIAASMPLSEYFFANMRQQVNPDSLDNRARLAELARPLIAQIPEGIFKEMMFEQLARLLESSPQVMRGGKAGRFAYTRFTPKAATFNVLPPPKPMAPAMVACALILREPSLYQHISSEIPFWRELVAPGKALFERLLEFMKQSPELSAEKLRELIDAQDGSALKKLQDCETKVALIPAEGLSAEFLGTISRLQIIGRQQMTEKLLQKAKVGNLNEEEKQQLKEFLKFRESI